MLGCCLAGGGAPVRLKCNKYSITSKTYIYYIINLTFLNQVCFQNKTNNQIVINIQFEIVASVQARLGCLEIRVPELKRKEGRSRVLCSIMAASTRSQVISLYKMMLKESSRFPSYNYRWVRGFSAVWGVLPAGLNCLSAAKHAASRCVYVKQGQCLWNPGCPEGELKVQFPD